VDQALFTTLNERIWAGGARREDLVQRVAGALREQIVAGDLKVGARLVPEAELAKSLGISRPSLREAIRIIASEGLVVVKHGIGTFVTAHRKPMLGSLEMTRSLTDLIRASGGEPASRDLLISRVKAPKDVAEGLDLAEGAEVGLVSRVRTTDNTPFVVAEEYVVLGEGGHGFDTLTEFTGGSLYEFMRLRFDFPIAHSKLTISAVAAGAAMAKVLGLRKGAPLLLMQEVHYGFDGRPGLLAVNYHNTDVVEFTSMRSGTLA
jgi:GntR family transcriptional regulator